MAIPTFGVNVTAVVGEAAAEKPDALAVEEPLEIVLGHGPSTNRRRSVVAVTMRTPGHDAELAVGHLVGEGLLDEPSDLLAVASIDTNSIRVDLKPGVAVDLDRLRRRGVLTSSCGVCGKTMLDAIEAEAAALPDGPTFAIEAIHGLPERLREAQASFDATGGLHAIGLFDAIGDLLSLREDVGRHNAADKVIGAEFLAGRLPLAGRLLFSTSRASFELVQKAAVAGVPAFAAIGAPTSLAVQLAERFNVTLVGFVRDGRFNVYAGRDRFHFRTASGDPLR